MDNWDIALAVIASFVAVVGLVRLMNHRRDQLADELLDEVAQHSRH